MSESSHYMGTTKWAVAHYGPREATFPPQGPSDMLFTNIIMLFHTLILGWKLHALTDDDIKRQNDSARNGDSQTC